MSSSTSSRRSWLEGDRQHLLMHSMEEEDGVDDDMVGLRVDSNKVSYCISAMVVGCCVLFRERRTNRTSDPDQRGHPLWKGHRTRTKAQHHTLLHCSGLLQSILMMEY